MIAFEAYRELYRRSLARIAELEAELRINDEKLDDQTGLLLGERESRKKAEAERQRLRAALEERAQPWAVLEAVQRETRRHDGLAAIIRLVDDALAARAELALLDKAAA